MQQPHSVSAIMPFLDNEVLQNSVVGLILYRIWQFIVYNFCLLLQFRCFCILLISAAILYTIGNAQIMILSCHHYFVLLCIMFTID